MKKTALQMALETIEEYANLSEFEINKKELLELDEKQRDTIYETGKRKGYAEGYNDGFYNACDDMDD